MKLEKALILTKNLLQQNNQLTVTVTPTIKNAETTYHIDAKTTWLNKKEIDTISALALKHNVKLTLLLEQSCIRFG